MSVNKNVSRHLREDQPNIGEVSRESRILDNIRHVVFELDAQGSINFVNQAWHKLTGHPTRTSASTLLGAYIHPDDAGAYTSALDQIINNKSKHASLQLRLLKRDGQSVWADLSIDAQGHDDETILYGQIRKIAQSSFSNTTHNLNDEQDSITGACSRHYFELKLQEQISRLSSQGEQHSLIYLELLNFKLINQALSHHDGDIVLKEIATLISSSLHNDDLLCRIGGYEFAVFLHNRSGKAASEMAQKLLKLLSGYRYSREPFSFIVGGNIGVRLVDDNSISAAHYIADAVKATAVSKTLGRNRSYLFSNDSDDFYHSHGCDWNHRIHEAIKHGRLQLYLQPIESISNRQVNHYEALLRMTVAETGEIIRPERFIHAIERTGAIREVDLWVISNAISILSQRPEIERLAINLSAHAFEDAELITLIQSELKHHNVAPERVIIELTETSSLINLEQTHAVIKNLRAIGCKFALDDFGTGYCSFSYLKHLPTDYVKLDGSYIKNICDNELDEAMVRSMNDIAHALGHKTIAECVESPQAINLLSDIGVDYIQGYSIGKPLPVSNLH